MDKKTLRTKVHPARVYFHVLLNFDQVFNPKSCKALPRQGPSTGLLRTSL